MADTDTSPEPIPPPKPSRGGGGVASSLVAAGILLSRISGLIRQSIFAQYLGNSAAGDAFTAGFRTPNALQNLLGEGTLSASFIPVYAELLEKGRKEEAGRVAGAVFSLLLALAGALSLFGILFAPVLVSVFLPGFTGEKRDLTIQIVRIIFPTTGVLVLSAWALGILNSHRKFFISYVAPVLSNGAMIATLLFFGRRMDMDGLVVALAWGALAGGFLQFAIQVPWILRLERELKVGWNTKLEGVRETVRNAGPAIMGRGVVQLSSYLDVFLASFLADGAVVSISYAQQLYLLPVSLFGMSVAAAELPELARQRDASLDALRERASRGLQRIAFYVVPSFVAFILLGDLLIAALFQRGQFAAGDTYLVYLILFAMSLGLLPSTGTRLLSSTFFALRDTRTPARFAAIRVACSAVASLILMVQFEPLRSLGIPAGFLSGLRVDGQTLGAVGLAAGSGVGAWVEWALLRRALRKRVGRVGAGAGPLAKMFVAALSAAAVGWLVRLGLSSVAPELHTILVAGAVVAVFGTTYFVVAGALKLQEVAGLATRVKGLLGR